MQLCAGALVLHEDGTVAYCTQAPPTVEQLFGHDCSLERHRTFVSCRVLTDDRCSECRRVGADRVLALAR